MPDFRLESPGEQVANYLRQELTVGRWGGRIPGLAKLAAELGINHKTVMAAMRILEEEGLIIGQGRGRKRVVVAPKMRPPGLRIAWLEYDQEGLAEERTAVLRRALEKKGHTVIYPQKTLHDLEMKVARVRRLVKQTEADAWVVTAATRDLLEWFSTQDFPSFALFGRRRGIPIASVGPDKPPVIRKLTRRMLELGHRRIVLLCRLERRHPRPGTGERAFLAALEGQGIRTGKFNLPDWDETPEGLTAILDSLFAVTPPTAMLIDEAPLFVAVQQYLGHRGLKVPEHVSLACTDASPAFNWCYPSITHIAWAMDPVAGRMVEWAENIAKGRHDIVQVLTPAHYVEGGTLAVCSEVK